MTQERVKELALLAQDIRITGLKMVQGSRSGHLGGGVFHGRADGGALF